MAAATFSHIFQALSKILWGSDETTRTGHKRGVASQRDSSLSFRLYCLTLGWRPLGGYGSGAAPSRLQLVPLAEAPPYLLGGAIDVLLGWEG